MHACIVFVVLTEHINNHCCYTQTNQSFVYKMCRSIGQQVVSDINSKRPQGHVRFSIMHTFVFCSRASSCISIVLSDCMNHQLFLSVSSTAHVTSRRKTKAIPTSKLPEISVSSSEKERRVQLEVERNLNEGAGLFLGDSRT